MKMKIMRIVIAVVVVDDGEEERPIQIHTQVGHVLGALQVHIKMNIRSMNLSLSRANNAKQVNSRTRKSRQCAKNVPVANILHPTKHRAKRVPVEHTKMKTNNQRVKIAYAVNIKMKMENRHVNYVPVVDIKTKPNNYCANGVLLDNFKNNLANQPRVKSV